MIRGLVVVLLNFVLMSEGCGHQPGSPAEAGRQTPTQELSRETSVIPETPRITTEEVMKNVADTYSALKHYSADGLTRQISVFNGRVKESSETEFHVEYDRQEGNSLIRWSEEGKIKALIIDGARARLEVDGVPSTTFTSPREGLTSISLTPSGLSRFLFSVFLFQKELTMPNLFFAGLKSPAISKEDDIDGRECYLLSGSFKRGETSMFFWIDKQNYLVRRIDRVIVIRKEEDGKRYAATTTISETYSDIEVK